MQWPPHLEIVSRLCLSLQQLSPHAHRWTSSRDKMTVVYWQMARFPLSRHSAELQSCHLGLCFLCVMLHNVVWVCVCVCVRGMGDGGGLMSVSGSEISRS